MGTLKLNRLSPGMPFEECIFEVTEGDVGVIMTFFAVCDRAKQLLGVDSPEYGLLSILDSFKLYGDELAHVVGDICDCDPDSVLKVIWSLELGNILAEYGKEIPFFAKIENIRQMVLDIVSGKRIYFPFGEAEAFIKSNSQISFG
ncbi:MAG: hypothetical protein PHW52_01120 [Candidatus Pacebacteria bacterium]|nr:hypothetical protein [Candidatus Paceibacterota bacterium]